MNIILTFFILTQVTPEWIKRYTTNSEGKKILYKDGYVYAGGIKYLNDTTIASIVLKYDTSGNLIQEYEYTSPWQRASILKDFVVDDSGSIYIASAIYHPDSGYDYGVLKFKENGELAWDFIHGELEGGDDIPVTIKIGKDKKIYATGYIYGCCGANFDFFTVKLTPQGTKIWQNTYGYLLDSPDKATDMTIDENGNIWICGITYDTNMTYQSLVVLEYDTMATTLFTDVYNPPDIFIFPNKIHSDNLGNIYVAGTYTDRGNSDYLIAKYSIQGIREWILTYGEDPQRQETAKSCGTDSLGNLYVTGTSAGDIMTLKITPDSNIICNLRYDYAGGIDAGYDIKVEKYGNSYITGWSENTNGDMDFVTINYRFCGAQLWAVRYDGINLNDYSYSIVLKDTDEIYIAGTSDTVTNDTISNMVIIKYVEGQGIKENKLYRIQGAELKIPTIIKDKIILPINPFTHQPIHLYIYNKSGRKIIKIPVREKILNLRELNIGSGAYFIKLESKNYKRTQKIMFLKK